MTSAHDINSAVAEHWNRKEVLRLSSISSHALRHDVLLACVVADRVYLEKSADY
jgi:hypothetical protein